LPNGQRGVLVTGVNDGSTAEKSGIKPGDVIIAIDGEATTSSGQLRSQLGVKGIDDTIAIDIIRESQTMQFNVRVAEPKNVAANLPGSISRLLEGARFENHSSGQGVVVSSIAPNSNAGYSGLRQGDIVISANRRRVTDLDSFQKALSGNYTNLLLQINRNGYVFFLVIR
jgi:S1-C subfamily serine protease